MNVVQSRISLLTLERKMSAVQYNISYTLFAFLWQGTYMRRHWQEVTARGRIC